jgi:hypothetical protein
MEYIALLISVISGATLVVVLKPSSKIVQVLLTFSGAYLLAITLLNFLPEIYTSGVNQIGIFVVIGLVIQLVLDFFSKGAEHGHFHHDGQKHFPYSLFISLNIHAFMEGLPLADHQHSDLLWAIVIHHLPIAMVLASFMLISNWNKKLSVFFILLFGLMTPLGAFIGGSVQFLIDYHLQINAIVAGVLLHIATIILFESSQNHKFNFIKFTSVLIGIALAFLV